MKKGRIMLKLGQVVVTRGINNKIAEDGNFAKFVSESLNRYKSGDWGDLCKEDKQMNDSAVKNNDDRIVARYNNIYIITEYDRSYTTILFIDEY